MRGHIPLQQAMMSSSTSVGILHQIIHAYDALSRKTNRRLLNILLSSAVVASGGSVALAALIAHKYRENKRRKQKELLERQLALEQQKVLLLEQQRVAVELIGTMGPTDGSIFSAGGDQPLTEAEQLILLTHQAANEAAAAKANEEAANKKKKKAAKGPAVDMVFVKRLLHILKLIIPRAKSAELLHLVLLTVFLVGRTFLSITVADNMGFLSRDLASRNVSAVLRGMIRFGLVAIPGSFLNSAIQYETSYLALLLRERLCRHVHEVYLKDMNFYKASNLGANRIDNADQRVTQDIDKFCTSLSTLYTNLFKPMLDVVMFTQKIGSVIGLKGPLAMYLYFAVSAVFLRSIMPSFAKLTSEEQKLEGDFRHVHSRLIAHAEEVAFYGGSATEKHIINRAFDAIAVHSKRVFMLRLIMGVIDYYMVKYGSAMVGFTVLAAPIYFGTRGFKTKSASEITGYYIRNMQLMSNLGKAIGNLVTTYKRVTQLAGFTARVSELLEQVNRLSAGQSKNQDEEEAVINELGKENYFPPRVIEGDAIKFEHVSIFSPDGDLLVRDLNFEVTKNKNVLVTGPNGSGKSSLFRVLGGLWPLRSGTLTRPKMSEIFYIPQKPYLVLGTLRAQIIYPQNEEEFLSQQSTVTDSYLASLLNMVHLSYLIEREGGLDAVKDWEDVLSGGEKQRIAMARLFYHKPKYAILDECTSAVSVDVEGRMYELCKVLGITLFTVSHRPSLQRFHDYLLKFEGDGKGGWSFTPIDHGKQAEQQQQQHQQFQQAATALTAAGLLRAEIEFVKRRSI